MIGLHARKYSTEVTAYTQQVVDRILKEGHDIMLFPPLMERRACLQLPEGRILPYTVANLKRCHAVFCIGGDGTMLETVTYVKDSGIPILGINTGRLGFLASIAKDDIQEALSLFFSGRYGYEVRSLLKLQTTQGVFDAFCFALNEFVIFRCDRSSMIGVTCYVDDHFVGKFWADGVMVATPTGSTAYSLSCGGPVSAPTCAHFILTPVSPHNLGVRPLVIPDSSKLTFGVQSHAKEMLVSLDARSETVPCSTDLSVCKASFHIRLVQLEGAHFFDTLRRKMKWGVDIRK